MQALPRLRLGAGLEDNSDILIRSADAPRALDLGFRPPDFSFIAFQPLLGRAWRAAIGNIKEISALAEFIADGHWRPKRSAWISARVVATRFIERGIPLPVDAIGTRPVSQFHFDANRLLKHL